MLGQIFNMLYNWVDSYWGGKLGSEALFSFGITFPIFLFAIALGQGMASGAMVMIANALGTKNIGVAKHYMKQGVLLASVMGVLLAIIIIIFAKPVLSFLGASGLTLKYSVEYISILAIGVPFLHLFFTMNTTLISQGNTTFMRNILILKFFINLVLDPLLMYGYSIANITIIPALGIKGIALATVLVHILGALLTWRKIQRIESTQWIKGDSNKLKLQSIKKITMYGLPTFLQIALASLGIGIINYFLSRIGVNNTGIDFSSFHKGGQHAVAGYGIGLRIEQLVLVPSIGLGMALSALVGQNNGAKNYRRIRESFIKTILMSTILWLCFIPIVWFGVEISDFFTEDPQVIQVAYFYLFYAFIMFMGYQVIGFAANSLNSMKHPWVSITVLVIRHTILPIIFIPYFAYTLQKGIYGVFLSMVASVWISAALLLIIFMITIQRNIKKTG